MGFRVWIEDVPIEGGTDPEVEVEQVLGAVEERSGGV